MQQESTTRARVTVQAEAPVCQIVWVGNDSYHGPIGNKGTAFCNDAAGCKVAAHHKNRGTQSFEEGFYIELKKGYCLPSPFVPQVVANKYRAEFEQFEQGAAKEVIIGFFGTLNDLELTKLSDEDKRRDVQAFISSALRQGGAGLGDANFDLARVVMTPQKVAKTTVKSEDGRSMSELYPDLFDDDLEDDEVTRLKNTSKVQADFLNEYSDQMQDINTQVRIMRGQLGRSSTVDPPVVFRLTALEDIASILIDGSKDLVKKVKAFETSATVQGTTLQGIEARLSALEQSDRTNKANLKGMMDNVNKVIDHINQIHTQTAASMVVTPDTTKLEEEMKSLRAEVQNVRDGNQEYDLGGGSVTFAGSADVEAFAARQPANTWHHLAFGAVEVLASMASGVVETTEVQQQELHAEKVHREASQTKFLGAGLSVYPSILVGKSKSDRTSSRVNLGAIATYAQFNKNNGFDGVSTFIIKNLGKTSRMLEQELMEAFRGLPEHQQLGKYLLAKSCDFIRSAFQFMETMRRELLTQGYGEAPYSATAEKEVWELCLLMLVVVFDVLWETRGEAAHGYQSSRANFIYLNAALKTHMEMEHFVKTAFSEHPSIMPKLQRYIFETFVSKSDFQTLEGEHRELKTTVAGVKRSLDSIQSQWSAGGGGGGGGAGAGALTAAQKRRQKKKAAQAQDETEE